MARQVRPGEVVKFGAREISLALQAGEQLAQQQRSGVVTSGSGGESARIVITVRNDHTRELQPFSLTRWSGATLVAAGLESPLPPLDMRTVATATDSPIGVVQDLIYAGDTATSLPAGLGPVAISGLSWARCRGPIALKDKLMPDSQFRGIKDTSGNSNVTALASVSGTGTDAIIPVMIGPPSGNSCVKKYQLFILGATSSGSFVLPVRAPDPGGTLVTENVTILHNSTVTQTKTAIEGHSLIDVDSVLVVGSASLTNSNHMITLPSDCLLGNGGTGDLDSSGLVRSGLILPAVKLLECCS